MKTAGEEDVPVDELTTLLSASLHFTSSSEARQEARRIIEAVRTEAYRRGYADGRFDGPDCD